MVRTCLQCGRPGFDLWVRKIPWRRAWQSTLVFLPGESHEQLSLASYSSWGCKESDMTKHLTFIYFNMILYYKSVQKLYTEFLHFLPNPDVIANMLFSRSVVSNSFATPLIAACQAPLFRSFPRQEY